MATALPAAADFTGSSITEADFKDAMTDLRTFLSDLLGADGTEATAQAALGAAFSQVLTKSASYPVLAADLGKIILYSSSSSYTLTTPAAATVGAGFFFAVKNTGTGTVTIDGNSSETVDGSATIAIAQYESCVVVSDGTNWITVGRIQALGTDSVTGAMIADSGKATSVMAQTNTPQSTTATWTDYLSTTVYVSSNSYLRVIAIVSMAESSSSTPGQIRVVVDGTAGTAISTNAGTVDPTISAQSSKLITSGGTKTIKVQIYSASATDWIARSATLFGLEYLDR